VIWRGRKFDYFLSLTPSSVKQWIPEIFPIGPSSVFVHEDDDERIVFSTSVKKKEPLVFDNTEELKLQYLFVQPPISSQNSRKGMLQRRV
jgi:hypothetical protein